MRTLTFKIELYAIGAGEPIEWVPVRHSGDHVEITGMEPLHQMWHMFSGPAKELQAWCAKRNIPYQHVTLHVPVELEI